jgi:hypothetical protein
MPLILNPPTSHPISYPEASPTPTTSHRELPTPHQDEYKDAPGSVITADFYGASELMPLTDDQLVERVVSHITACEPGFAGAKVVDSAVLKFRKVRAWKGAAFASSVPL